MKTYISVNKANRPDSVTPIPFHTKPYHTIETFLSHSTVIPPSENNFNIPFITSHDHPRPTSQSASSASTVPGRHQTDIPATGLPVTFHFYLDAHFGYEGTKSLEVIPTESKVGIDQIWNHQVLHLVHGSDRPAPRVPATELELLVDPALRIEIHAVDPSVRHTGGLVHVQLRLVDDQTHRVEFDVETKVDDPGGTVVQVARQVQKDPLLAVEHVDFPTAAPILGKFRITDITGRAAKVKVATAVDINKDERVRHHGNLKAVEEPLDQLLLLMQLTEAVAGSGFVQNQNPSSLEA